MFGDMYVSAARGASTWPVIRHGVKKIGKNATVAVFPEAGETFPIVS